MKNKIYKNIYKNNLDEAIRLFELSLEYEDKLDATNDILGFILLKLGSTELAEYMEVTTRLCNDEQKSKRIKDNFIRSQGYTFK